MSQWRRQRWRHWRPLPFRHSLGHHRRHVRRQFSLSIHLKKVISALHIRSIPNFGRNLRPIVTSACPHQLHEPLFILRRPLSLRNSRVNPTHPSLRTLCSRSSRPHKRCHRAPVVKPEPANSRSQSGVLVRRPRTRTAPSRAGIWRRFAVLTGRRFGLNSKD